MLIILILLLTFTDFELSGQNIETEAMFLKKFKEMIFYTYCNILVTLHLSLIYIENAKETRTIHSENLTSGQIFFYKEGLFWLV